MGKYDQLFRTGKSKDSTLEFITKALNEAMGSAYDTSEGTIVNAQNYSFAKAINDLYNSSERASNQFDPNKVTALLERFESIYKIFPSSITTTKERRDYLALKIRLAAKPPNHRNVSDLLQEIMGDSFIEIYHHSYLENQGSIPGGLSNGVVDIPDGYFTSPICECNVRYWINRDKNDNIIKSEFLIEEQINKAKSILLDYLPSYIMPQFFKYGKLWTGTISCAAGSNLFTGVLSNFTGIYISSVPYYACKFEVVNDDNILETFSIQKVNNDTSLETIKNALGNITNRKFRVMGFYLDSNSNLDNECFC